MVKPASTTKDFLEKSHILCLAFFILSFQTVSTAVLFFTNKCNFHGPSVCVPDSSIPTAVTDWAYQSLVCFCLMSARLDS